jgi:hypothetical protein
MLPAVLPYMAMLATILIPWVLVGGFPTKHCLLFLVFSYE